MELKSIKKKFNGVLTLVLTIAALTVGQSVWAASSFTVTNTSGTSKFVITRTSNTSATETVNYRTVSLSAIAGQHFTDKTGTLTFDAIHNSREVEVTENTPGTDAYKYQNGTSRKYRFEVLDQGGFRLAYTDRTITTGTSVPSSNAFAVKDVIIQTNEYTADDKGYDKNGYKSVSSSSFFTSSNAPKNYLKHIGAQLLMTLSFQGKENDDAYEYLQLLFNETTNCDGRSGKSNGDPGDPNLSSYMAGFEMNTGTKDDTYRSYTFPILDVESGGKANDPWGYDPTNHKWPLKKQNFKSGSRATDGRIIVPMDFSSIVLRLNASGGSGSDEWAVKNVKAHIQAVDGTAPSRLGDPVISGSMHAKGNTFYVSVPFDEIVTVSGTPTLSTTWGSASYVSSNGGSGSNVLTFSGTITASAGKALTVNSISGTIKDLAGNELSSAGKAINKNIGTTVDANHTFTITYDLADGTVATANPDSYTYETATFTLKKPIRAGYTFAGWTGSNGNTPQTTVTIPAGSHGNKAYTANWTPLWGQDDGKTGEDKDHAYVISSTDGLDMLAKVVNGTDGYTANTFEGKFFKLGADITYTHISEWNNANSTENNYTAIGRLSVNKYYTFMGTFDGDGYTVSGIRIYKNSNTDACNYQGLFGLIGQQGIVRNITLDDSRITGNKWSGGIAGNSVGTVDNCHVTDQVLIHTLSTGNKHGGIAGRNSGLLQNSTSAATLSANSVNAKEYGGIAGYNLGTVQNCLAVGTSISSQNQYVGAIVGVNDGGTLVSNYYRNCTVGSTANAINVGVGGESSSTDQAGARSVHTLTLVDGVTASGESVIIGSYTYYASNTTVTLGYSQAVAQQITYHYNDGSDHDITGNTFTMPASDVTVSATLTDVWGITSGKDGTTSEKAYTITSTAGLDLLATLVNGGNDFDGKYFKLDADITYTHTTNWNDATSTENNYTAIGARINDLNRYFRGTFDGQNHTVSGIRIYKGGTTDADSYQGLFGLTSDATIRNVILTDARITGMDEVGGIAGYITDNAGTGGIVENCRVGSDVTIHAVAEYAFYHGGVVGDCNGGTISGCVSSATLTVANGLTGINEYGGIVGYLGGDMSDCLTIDASVPAVNMNGAIAGHVATYSTATNNYYYNCTVGGATTNVGIGAEQGNTTSHDRDGARSVHSLTLPTGVTATGESVTIGTDTYYVRYTTITLNIPTGYVMSSASYNDGTYHDITGNTFTMPAADVTVSATLTDLWDITSDKDGTTAEKAYTITSTAGLDLLATLVNGGNDFDGKYFKLGADITYTNTTDWNDATSTENNYTAIGGYVDGNWRYFGGTFDGQNHTVRGIRIYKGGTTNADGYQGLFGRTIGATIRNVILADARITGRQYVGGIAGYTESAETGGIVENCRVGSDVCIHAVADHAYYHGGVVGDCNGGTISGCVSSATLTVTNGLTSINTYGGIVGSLGGNMSDCLSIDVSVPDVNRNGAIAGEVARNRTLTNNYYYNCTVGGATTNVGIGAEQGNTTSHDRDGAYSVHSLTLPTGVTATGESVTIGTDTYYVRYTTVTLNIPTGYVMSSASYYDGTDYDITDNTFTMPAADVTVTADYIMTWASLKSAMQNGGTFTLPYDITATETDTYLYVPSGKTVTLDLNGHTINRNLTAAANNGYVIGVNGTLTINDSSDSNTGSITGGNSTDKCGGVYVSGTFTMNGGTISNNSGSWGGGVYVQGTFNMNGGTISNNSGSWGGGVYVYGTFTMNGGTISGNTATSGGGVYVYNDKTINISGNPVITGNTLSNNTTANNVYLKPGSVITVTDALTNTANIGVIMQNNTGVFTSGLNGNGTVANFTCDNSSECGVYLNGNGEASIIVDVWGIPDGADGTSEATAYTITTTRDLDLLAKMVNGTDGFTADKFDGKFFKLGNDITYAHTTDWNDVTSTENNYTSIGFQYNKEFWGTFDGDGYTISGIRIYKGNENCQGLFGYARGTVKNVTLSDARITGCNNVGGIVGYLTNYTDQLIGTVNNCHVDGTVTIQAVVNSAESHGGIVGAGNGSVSNCTSSVTFIDSDGLTTCSKYGGIVGYATGGTISNCLAVGVTIPAVLKMGAIVAVNAGGTLTANYYLNCTVGGNTTNVGNGSVDPNGSRSVHSLTLADGVTASGESVTIGTDTYYASNTNVTFTYNGSIPRGYVLDIKVKDANDNDIAVTYSNDTYTFKMPACDATVSGITDVWGIASGADGSEAHPYIITTTAGLDLLAKMVNGIDGYTADKFDGKFFKLGNDITYAHTTDWNDATSIENNYTSIGFQYDKEFWGTFDGDGHTISGIRIYKGNNNCQGLFGYARGTVKNVTLSDARITGCNNVGGIVGFLTDTKQLIGTVNNCHVDGNVAIHTVVSNADYHGGIVGYSSTVINCTSQAVLTVADNLTKCNYYGGIVGRNNGNVSNCTSSATIIVGNGVTNCRNYGGIVGQNNGSVSSCLAIGATIPDVGYSKGAIAGRHDSGSLATNYYYNCTIGDVSNATSVGVGPSDINNNNNPEGAVVATILSELETVPGNLDGKVAFRREFTGGKASTICLPFALTDIEGGKAYEFVDVTYDAVDGWVATMNEVTATVANKPYLFLPEGSGSVPVLFHGTAGYDVSGGLATTSGDWTFTGTYARLTYGMDPFSGTVFGFAAKAGTTVDGQTAVEAGQFVKAAAGAYIPPMRAYLTYSGSNTALHAPTRGSAATPAVPSRIKVRLLGASGNTTAVGTIEMNTGDVIIERWFDMNGRPVDGVPAEPGMFINNNGKKVMIK